MTKMEKNADVLTQCIQALKLLDAIHKHRSNNKYVALLTLDASAAFDLLDHSVISRSLEVTGAGPLLQKWCASFLAGCKSFVQIGEEESDPWIVESGSGQGRPLSPDLYNLSTFSQAIIVSNPDFFNYADDGGDVICGDSIELCNAKIKTVLEQRIHWYRSMGLSLNIAKTEIMGFNFKPENITIGNTSISPKSEITFLGVKIQSSLKWNCHIETLCRKIRAAAGRIRMDGRHLGIPDKKILYFGWIQSLIQSNGLAYLPTLNQSELIDLQTACNAGIRSIVGLPRFGYAEISVLRKHLRIPSISAIKNRVCSVAAWKHFSVKINNSSDCTGPITRGRSNNNIPLPDMRGHAGKISSASLTKAWNALPIQVKNANSISSVKHYVKKSFM